MKKILAIALCALPFALAPAAYAQTTGSAAAVTDASGWSVKDDVLGKAVINENDDKVGDITDVIVSDDGKVSSFIVGAGGFLGMGEHNVAIPFDRITKQDNKLLLAGYTKDQLKELPAYKSRKSDRTMTPAAGSMGGAAAPGSAGVPPAGTAPSTTTPSGTATTPGSTTAPATSAPK